MKFNNKFIEILSWIFLFTYPTQAYEFRQGILYPGNTTDIPISALGDTKVTESIQILSSTNITEEAGNATLANLTRLAIPTRVAVPVRYYPIRTSSSSSSSNSGSSSTNFISEDTSQTQDSQFTILTPPPFPLINFDFGTLSNAASVFIAFGLLLTLPFWLPTVLVRKRRDLQEDLFQNLHDALEHPIFH